MGLIKFSTWVNHIFDLAELQFDLGQLYDCPR